jgi:hypothetical protein
MVRVTGPLLSQKASGKFGKDIVFRCGKFVVKSPKPIKEKATDDQNKQRKKFENGAYIWAFDLTSTQRTNWENFAKSIRHDKGYFTIPVPFGPIYVRIGEKKQWKECIETYRWNGYQYFQSCFLRFGQNGWIDYPNPPPFP